MNQHTMTKHLTIHLLNQQLKHIFLSIVNLYDKLPALRKVLATKCIHLKCGHYMEHPPTLAKFLVYKLLRIGGDF